MSLPALRTSTLLAIVVCATAMAFAENPEHHESRWSAAQLAGFDQVSQHRFDEALASFRQAFQFAITDAERGASAGNIGILLHMIGGSEAEALNWLDRAHALLAAVEPSPTLQARVDVALAEITRNTSDYKTAEGYLREAMTASEKDPVAFASIENALADLLREQGRTDEAKALFTATLAGPGLTPQLRENALLGLADIDRSEGKSEISAREWNSAIDLARSGHDEVSEAIALRGLGETWFDSGSPARAEPLFRKSLSLLESIPSATEQKAIALTDLGRICHLRNKLAMAEDFFSKALAIERKVFGDRHPHVAHLMEEIASVYADRGAFALARDWAAQAFETMREAFGIDSMPAASALTTQAYVEARDKHMDTAAEDYSQALEIARCHPEHRAFRVGLIQRYQDVLKSLHRKREVAALDLELRSLQGPM